MHILHVETISLKGIEEERKKSQTNKQFAKKKHPKRINFNSKIQIDERQLWQTTVTGLQKQEQMNIMQKKKKIMTSEINENLWKKGSKKIKSV